MACLFACLLMLQVPPPDGVRLAPERLVLRTDCGYIVIALYSDLAPGHVEQMLRLAKLGVFNGTYFHRVEPNFVLQLRNAEDYRNTPLDDELRRQIKKLPLELSKLPHRRGVVSMAHYDEDVNSATTSFSIMLGDAPHLDGKYTIIGHVEYGMDVVDELVKVPLDSAGNPRFKLWVNSAAAVPGELLHKSPPRPARPLNIPQEFQPPSLADLQRAALQRQFFLAIGIALMMSFCLIGVFNSRLTAKQVQTFNLLAVLVGSFLLAGLLIPLGHDFFASATAADAWRYVIPVLVFFGLLGLFRLMSRFESAS
jgi:cyclophilin family peptidyl-prolyl cis-trans isomerase